MTKEQFLAISVPFGLIGTVEGKENVSGAFIYTLHACFHKTSVCEVTGNSTFYTDKFKPILRPLTDLTKEIEHKGEKFVPIEKLKEIIGGGWCDVYERAVECIEEWDIDTLKNKIKYLPFEFVQFFVSWHFDIFGGIDNGEAIDVNTLDKNPYA